MSDRDDETERRLRATLTHRAAQAPPGDALADRIVARALDTDASSPRRRAGRIMPLLAAASVAAVVASVLGLSHLGGSSASKQPAYSRAPTASALGAPTPLYSATTRSPKAQPTRSSASSVAPVGGGYHDPNGVTGFRALDLTFIGDGEGWALGPADCASGAGRCIALFHTTGGDAWTSMPVHGLDVVGESATCPHGCVDRIRFATSQDGYAFASNGSAPLFTTTDGGLTWNRQAGNTVALEALQGNVIRVVESGPGCPGTCNLRVEVAAIGSSSWTTHPLRGGRAEGSVQLMRAGSVAYVLSAGDAATGRGAAVFASTDSGAHWVARGEPCARVRSGSSTVSLAAGVGDVLTLACSSPDRRSTTLAVSSDAGAHVSAVGPIPEAATSIVGDPATQLLAVGARHTYRSTDGGRAWHLIPALAGQVGFVGFESTTTGRALLDGGRRLLTTHDGGASWHAVVLS